MYFYKNKKQLALYNSRCLASCPVSNPQLIVYQGACVQCQTGCLTCSQIPNNCTQCALNYVKYTQGNFYQCLSTCPNNL